MPSYQPDPDSPAPTAQTAFPPLEPSELAREAENFEFNPLIPLKHYVGALDTLYRQGRNYLQERNFAQAYLLLFRFSILYLDKVSTLPAAHTPAGRRLLKTTRKRINGVLVELENIKPDLLEARNRWNAEHPTAVASAPPASSSFSSSQSLSSSSAGYPDFAARDAALSWNAKARATLLNAVDYQDFAVDLATQELTRRRTTRQAAGMSREEERTRRTGGLWDDWDQGPTTEPPTTTSTAAEGENELRSHMEQARRQLDRQEGRQSASQEDVRDQPAPVSYYYPSIAKSAPLRYEGRPVPPALTPGPPGAMRPPRPPKEDIRAVPAPAPARTDSFSAPAVPPRRQLSTDSEDLARLYTPPPPSESPRPQPPQLPPKTAIVEPAATPAAASSEKETFTFRPAGYLEDGKPIRPVFLPDGLRKDFVRLATPNTRKGIETCGILCGTNINNALFITCLLVPEQHGTPDTCETTNEAATFEFFEKEDLLQIGWIHTHPTQTCFMSSRDLHTQAGYQIMMDESVAIVCSPSHEPSWGVFRLTKPPGLQHLLNCAQTDTFHQHSLPANALYKDAKNPPGHVFVTSRMDYWVRDLRKG